MQFIFIDETGNSGFDLDSIQLCDVGTYFMGKYWRILIKKDNLTRAEIQIKEMVEKYLKNDIRKVFP